MNNNVTKPNTNANTTPIRTCLISFIPKSNAGHMNISDVWERMSRFLSENKRLEIVYDFVKEKSAANEVYQDKDPNRLDTAKVIKKMHSLDCDVLIIPAFATLAESPDICSDILMELHESGIRIISPYDAFDSKIISKQVDKEATEFMQGLQKALLQVMEQHILNNLDEFEDYVDKTRFKHKSAPFCITYGHKALVIPYSEDLCAELFEYLECLDEKFLRPELYEDDEYDDENDEDYDIPKFEHEPLVERDFEG